MQNEALSRHFVDFGFWIADFESSLPELKGEIFTIRNPQSTIKNSAGQHRVERHSRGVGAGYEQIANALFQHRMKNFWGNLCEWLEDESSLRHSWMRNLKPGLINDEIAEKQNVDIQRAWSSRKGADPAVCSFDFLKASK
jgi:hypothetical protein